MTPSSAAARDRIFRRSSDVRFRTVLDEGVVIKQDTAEVLVLNEVGARILELLDGARTVGEVEATLASEFAAAPEELGRDVAAYLDELAAIGVVEPVAGPADERPGPA
jgi:hypothetical protein